MASPGATIAVRGNDLRSRNHAGYWAFLAHRVSGIVLALFLPVHFFVLSRALRAPAALAFAASSTRSGSLVCESPQTHRRLPFRGADRRTAPGR